MTSPPRGKSTREAILRAAVQLFSVHGYHNTSLNDILAVVSLSKGAFYHHFPGKEALALAVVDTAGAACAAAWSPASLGEAAESGRLAALLARLVELRDSGEWSYGLLLARLAQETTDQQDILTERIRDAIAALNEACAAAIADDQARRLLRTDIAPEALAAVVIAAWFGAAGLAEIHRDAPELVDVFGPLLRLARPQ